MPPLPDRVPATLKTIQANRLARRAPSRHGYGISISEAATECARAIWYGFRWATPPEQHSARMLRLFRTGEIEEERLLDDLTAIEGVDVLRTDPDTGRQWRVEIGGFIAGKMDAVATGLPEAPRTWHVVECKSANDKTFGAIARKGVERGKPEHWLQMQLYMLGTGIFRALYMLVNKNTDEEYVERVRLDRERALQAAARLESIAGAPRPPGRLHDDPAAATAFNCRFCRHRPVCHEGRFAERSCRTCLHASPLAGSWRCERYGRDLTIEEQKQGCPAHLFIPDLVPGEQVDADPAAATVTYRMPDGSVWIDGEGKAA